MHDDAGKSRIGSLSEDACAGLPELAARFGLRKQTVHYHEESALWNLAEALLQQPHIGPIYADYLEAAEDDHAAHMAIVERLMDLMTPSEEISLELTVVLVPDSSPAVYAAWIRSTDSAIQSGCPLAAGLSAIRDELRKMTV